MGRVRQLFVWEYDDPEDPDGSLWEWRTWVRNLGHGFAGALGALPLMVLLIVILVTVR